MINEKNVGKPALLALLLFKKTVIKKMEMSIILALMRMWYQI